MSSPARAMVDPEPAMERTLELRGTVTTLAVVPNLDVDSSIAGDQRYARLIYLRRLAAGRSQGSQEESPEERAERDAMMWTMQRPQAKVMDEITRDD